MTKSVFITGSTSLQAKGRGSQMGIITFPVTLEDALPSLGYEVRRGAPHEYDNEDIILMGWNTPRSFVSRYTWDAISLWDLARKNKIPLIPYYDDWRIIKCMNEIQMMTNPKLSKYDLKKHKGLRHEANFGEFDQKVVDEWLEWNAFGNFHFLMPMFDVGDHSILTNLFPNENAEAHAIDPSSFVRPYSKVGNEPSGKERVWILAALNNICEFKASVGATWPIRDYGRHKGDRKCPSYGGKVHETELQLVYNKAWGILAPPYIHAGSGWWRVRYLMSAWARSVIVPPFDDRILGDYYDVTVDEVEDMSTDQLLDIADGQRANLLSVIVPKVEALRRLEGAMDLIIQEWLR